MHSSIQVIKPTPTLALVTLYEAKTLLGIPTNSTTDDEALQFLIERASDEVQTLCSRFFPKETVIETFREVDNPITKLYLSRYPVKPNEITLIEGDGTPWDIEYDVDSFSGKLSLWGGNLWTSSISVEYSGGYALPHEVPPALKQAVLLFTKDAYHAAARGDSSIRQIAHKESRISYFDAPKDGGGASGSGSSGMSAAQKAAQSLLQRFTRLTA